MIHVAEARRDEWHSALLDAVRVVDKEVYEAQPEQAREEQPKRKLPSGDAFFSHNCPLPDQSDDKATRYDENCP